MDIPEIHHCDKIIQENTFYFQGKVFALREFSREQIEHILKSEYGIHASRTDLEKGYLAIHENKIWHGNIPKQFLSYVLVNEVLCSDVTGSSEGACSDALYQEISLVPLAIRPDYLHWRKDFFTHMQHIYKIGYTNQQKEGHKKYEHEMTLCVEYIDEELKKYTGEKKKADQEGQDYQKIGEIIGEIFPHIKKTLYPGCGDHTALKEMFPDSLRTYIDPNSTSMISLIGKDPDGEFFIGKAQEYKIQETFDLAFLSNTWDVQGVIEAITPLLGEGGYMLADGNEWNFTAENLFSNQHYTLVGVFIEKLGSLEYSMKDLESYIKPYRDDESSNRSSLPSGEYRNMEEDGENKKGNEIQYQKYAQLYLFKRVT